MQDFDLVRASVCPGALDVVTCFERSDRRASTDVALDEHLYVRGWSFSRDPRGPFEKYYFIIDRTRVLPIAYGLARNDVARAHRDPALTPCGFDVVVPVADLEPGEHVLSFAGQRGNRLESFAASAKFQVLAAPELITRVAAPAELFGRLRSARETYAEPRHDGRSERAIRHRSSLVIDGWVAANPSGAAADHVGVLLSGHGRVYRLPATRRIEPEAGVALGPAAAGCGYQTAAAADRILPGLYRVGIELGDADARRSMRTDTWIEIMQSSYAWLPSALPIYRTPFAGGLYRELPAQLKRNDELIVLGWTSRPHEIGGVFARLDGGATFALTSAAVNGPPANAAALAAEFGGLMNLRLPSGRHRIEVLALDALHSAAWLVAEHEFEITAEPL